MLRAISPLKIGARFGLFFLIGLFCIAIAALVVPLWGDWGTTVEQFMAQPSALPSLWQSLRIALLAQVGAVVLAVILLRGVSVHSFGIPRALSVFLAVPHVAFATGFAFLFSPSGWVLRLLSPWPSGLVRPPDWLIIHDPYGLAMGIVLILKETPFLFFVGLIALKQLPAERWYQQAASLGYDRISTWRRVVLPALLRLMVLPMLAVLVYSLSVVDIAAIVGPQRPVVFSVLMYEWFFDAEQRYTQLALMAAMVLLIVTLLAIIAWVLLVRGLAKYLQNSTRGNRVLKPRADNVLGRCLYWAIAAIFFGVIVVLLLFSIARGWRFPQAFPPELTLSAWQNMHLQSVLLDTLITAWTSGIIAVTLAVVIVEYQVQYRRQWPDWLLCFGLLVPQISVLFGMYGFALSLGLRGGWLLTIIGHVLFIFPYAYIAMSAPYRQFEQNQYRAALSLGRSPLASWQRVKWPGVRTILFASLAIALSSSILQFLPTQILGSGRVESVTVHAVTAASGFDRGVSARWALIQLLLGAIAFFLALWFQRRENEKEH